ncbi:MAG: hypothetical protein DWQ01_04960 [Planctomycetota bacterium]|nr:MAG: hypothetical protein DWQ01_04960 [Planctomycetota bacterium]
MSDFSWTNPLEVLAKVRSGQVSPREGARFCRDLPALHLLFHPEDVLQLLEEEDRKLQGGQLRSTQEEDPEAGPVSGLRLWGYRNPRGEFFPGVFTLEEPLRRQANQLGLRKGAPLFHAAERPWQAGLRHFLRQEVAGMVLNPGSPAAQILEIADLQAIFALLALDDLAAAKGWWAIGQDGSFALKTGPLNRVEALIFEDRQASREALPMLREFLGLEEVLEVQPAAFLRFLRRAGVDALKVNPTLGDERVYEGLSLSELGRLCDHHEAQRNPDHPLVQMAEAPHPPPKPLPRFSDREARSHLHDLKNQNLEAAVFLRRWAEEVPVYVGRRPRGVDGLSWPAKNNSPSGGDRAVWFTSLVRARACQSSDKKTSGTWVRLLGRDAARWAWSSPEPSRFIQIDPGESHGVDLAFPDLAKILFPLQRLPNTLDRAATLPAQTLGWPPEADPFDPACLKTLLALQDAILAPAPAWEGCRVHRNGLKWLPAFTSQGHWQEYRGIGGLAVPAQNGFAFPYWLEQGLRLGGVLLNPGSPHPLALEGRTLVLLDLWQRQGRQPTAAEWIEVLGQHLQAGLCDAEKAGELAAEIPHWVALRRTHFPGEDWARIRPGGRLVLFTTEGKATAWLRRQRKEGHAFPEHSPVRIWSRWASSAFDLPAAKLGAHLNPPGGLVLNVRAMEAARRMLNLRLTPRIPAFTGTQDG